MKISPQPDNLSSLKNKFRGQRAFILGNGPSLTQLDLTHLKNEYTFGVNSIFYLFDEIGFKPSFYVVEDTLVAEDRANEINQLSGMVRIFGTYLDYCIENQDDILWSNVLFDYSNYANFPHFSRDASQCIWVGGTVSYVCMQLAYMMGFDPVYLIGFDHSYDIPSDAAVEGTIITSSSEDPNHFHPEYFGKGKRWHLPRVDRMEQSYRKARQVYEQSGRRIFNATAGGHLEVFDRAIYTSLFPVSTQTPGTQTPTAEPAADRSSDKVNQPEITAVVCTHSNQNQLVSTLESLLVQSLAPDRYEVIIVDNASTDDTRAVCASFPQFRYIHEEKPGLSFARNAGIAAAQSDLIAFIDDDAEADQHWLKSLLETFQSNPDTWAAGGKVLPIWDAPKPDWLTEQYHRSLSLIDWGPETRPLSWPERVIGTNCAFRKDVFDQIGQFQTELGRVGKILLGNEDTEIQERIHESGKLVVYSPDAVVHHHVPAARMTREYLQRRDEGTIVSRQILQLRAEGKLDEAAARAHEYIRDRTLRDMQDVVQAKLEQTMHNIQKFRGCHSGERCVIIGNGPSLNNMDLSFLKEEITFATNRIYLGFDKFDFTPDYYLSVNPLVLEQSMDEIRRIPAPKFLSVHGIPHAPLEDPDFHFLRSVDEPIFSRNPGQGIWEGYTVTYVALQLAYYMGFEEVYLIGCDHSFATKGPANAEVTSKGEDPNHFAANYFGKGTRWHLPDLTNSEIAYRLAREAFKADGRCVFDATLNGKLTVFPKVSYSEVFLHDGSAGDTTRPADSLEEMAHSSMQSPLVSILIPVENWDSVSTGFLDSIQNQTIAGRMETLFISTGPENTVSQRNRERTAGLYGARHISLEGGSHFQAVNTGILESSGRYFLVLCPGDELLPSAVEKLASALERRPDAGLAYADFESRANPDRDKDTVRAFHCPDYHPMMALLANPLSPHTLYRRSTVLRAGVFDSRYSHAADYDLLLRLTGANLLAVRIPEILSSANTAWTDEPESSRLREEMARIRQRHAPALSTAMLLRGHGFSDQETAQAWAALGWQAVALNSDVLKIPTVDLEFAAHCFLQSLQLYLSYEAVHNLTAVLGQAQNWETAENVLARLDLPQFDPIKNSVMLRQPLVMIRVELPAGIPLPDTAQAASSVSSHGGNMPSQEQQSHDEIVHRIQLFSGSSEPISDSEIENAAGLLQLIISCEDPAAAVAENLGSLDPVLIALLEINIEQAYSDGNTELAQGLSNLRENIHLQMQDSTEGSPDAPLVSAIVSTFNASRFLPGCLDDLEQQSIATSLEIIVVNTGSEENETDIVREYQQKYDNIFYIHTDERETIYSAWNRGIRAARGKYITNANTDDRHHPHALERLVHELENSPDIGVVYADSAVTPAANTTLSEGPVTGRFRWPDFNRNLLFQVCYLGPQPMWRKELHDRYGLFDPEYKSAGDYEFWLRISDKVLFKHIPEVLGLYYESPASVEHSDPHMGIRESEQARERHWDNRDGPRPEVAGFYLERFDQFPDNQEISQLPLVSVIVPTYNRPSKLHAALESIAGQSYPAVEAVVINDAGNDVGDVIDHFKSVLNITYINLPENGGAGAARNAGLQAARGQFIAFLDDDDVFYPTHILALLTELISRPDAAGVYSDAFQVEIPEEGSDVREERNLVYSEDFSAERMLVQNYIPILCLMVRASILGKAGLFDEDLEAVEDWEWLIRVTGQGNLVHLPFVTAEYFQSPQANNRNMQSIESVRRLYTRIYRKHNHRSSGEILLNQSIFYRALTGGQLGIDAPELFSLPVPGADTGQGSQYEVIQKAALTDSPVDIVIPIYGQAPFVKTCVESVLNTTGSAHIILVDDRSPGNEIQSLFKTWEGHSRITLARPSCNLGFIGATRLGAELGKAPFILFLNSDTEALQNGWLDYLIPGEDDIAVTGAKLLFPPTAPPPFAGTIQHAGVARNQLSVPYHPYLGHDADLPEANIARDVNAVTGGCMLIRREIWSELGGWNPLFEKGVFEDVDFCWRVREKGLRVRYEPSACLYHYESASRGIDGQHPLHTHSDRNLRILLHLWPNMESDQHLFFPVETVARWRDAISLTREAEKYMEVEDTHTAVIIMRRAVKIAPDHPTTLLNLAQLLMKEQSYEQSLDILLRILELAPDMWRARFLLVAALLAQEEIDQAWEEIIILSNAFPDAPEIERYRNLALRYKPDLEETPSSMSKAETFLNELLDSPDIHSLLEERKDELDQEVLNLVHDYIHAAIEQGQPEVESAMRNLAHYIEDSIMNATNPMSEYTPEQLLQFIMGAEDTEAAIIQAEPHFDIPFLNFLRTQAQSARQAGLGPIADMYDNLAQYTEDILGSRNSIHRTTPDPMAEHGSPDNEEQTPVIVYQMGKVGSSSIVRSLKEAGNNKPIYHIHYLTHEGINRVSRANDHAPEPDHVRQSRELRSLLDHGTLSTRWKIITPVRDPVARNLSAFFENIHRWVPDFNPYKAPLPAAIERLQDIFMNEYPHQVPITWFEDEFIPAMGIDLYSTEFPQREGYRILQTSSADILLIQLEKMEELANSVFPRFLLLPQFHLAHSNLSRNKNYAEHYQYFKDTISLSTDYLDRMYSSMYASYFYSKEQITGFINRWSRCKPAG